VKTEFFAEYAHGHGVNFFLILARSRDEIHERYPLVTVYGLDEQIGVDNEVLEHLRMYPGAGRPRDVAVLNRTSDERQRFLADQQDHWERAVERKRVARFPGASIEAESGTQRWVDIDDDADFRMQMHELWKNDPRYLELPPERRLF
jgi:hypothetical protein